MLKPHCTPQFIAEAIKQVTERGYSVSEASERIGTLYK